MPKMKSNRGAAKTFKRTASGHYKRKTAFRSHILSSKTTKRKRQLRAPHLVSIPDEPRVKEMLLG